MLCGIHVIICCLAAFVSSCSPPSALPGQNILLLRNLELASGGGGVRKFFPWIEYPSRRNPGVVVYLGAENSGKRNVVYLGAKNPGSGAMDNAPEKNFRGIFGSGAIDNAPEKIPQVICKGFSGAKRREIFFGVFLLLAVRRGPDFFLRFSGSGRRPIFFLVFFLVFANPIFFPADFFPGSQERKTVFFKSLVSQDSQRNNLGFMIRPYIFVS